MGLPFSLTEGKTKIKDGSTSSTYSMMAGPREVWQGSCKGGRHVQVQGWGGGGGKEDIGGWVMEASKVAHPSLGMFQLMCWRDFVDVVDLRTLRW